MKRIQENIQQLNEDLEAIQNDDLFGPGNFNVEDFCLESRFAQEDLSPTTLGDGDIDVKNKPSSDHLDYNGNDSDLDNSESGVSSMESLESLLRKSETHDTPEVPDQIGEHSIEKNENETSVEKSENAVEQPSASMESLSDKNRKPVPVLILTDENGVVYSDKTDATIPSDSEPLTDSNDVTEEDVEKTDEEISEVEQVVQRGDNTDDIDGKPRSDNKENVDLNQSRDPEVEKEQESSSEKLPEANNDKDVPLSSEQGATKDDSGDQEPLDSSNNHEQKNQINENLPSELPITDDRISIESSSHQSIVHSVADDHEQADRGEQSKPSLNENTKESNDSTIELDNSKVNTSSDIEDESLARLSYIPVQLEYESTNNLEITDIERTASPANSQVSMEVQLSDNDRSPSDDLPENNLFSLLNRDEKSNGEVSSETQTYGESHENAQPVVNGEYEDDSSKILQDLRLMSSKKRTESPPAPQRVTSLVIQDSYQSPYFQEALERLRELNSDEVPLKEGMSLDVFVVEVEKLLEKLRVIEDMMRACQGVPDNVRDELARHVVCTQYVNSSTYNIIFGITLFTFGVLFVLVFVSSFQLSRDSVRVCYFSVCMFVCMFAYLQ